MDIGGPGGTGSSSNANRGGQAAQNTSQKPLSYMEAQGHDMNISMNTRKRKQAHMDAADPERRACGSCAIF